jgi:hypothetical protein
MIIANPIYDVVFKYLLEDIEIARELLATILGVNIIELVVKPQETIVKDDTGEVKIFHLDFKAVINLANGEQKTVLIELQKAKKSLDILRFRRYLGENYSKEEVRTNEDGQAEGYAIEIVTIYILGYKLAGVEVPVLKVSRNYTDAITQEEVIADNEFITKLTHESYTIQIPRLRHDQRNKLEEVLEVFSQDNITDDLHNIPFKQESKNPLVRKMVRRLSKAAGDEHIKRTMEAEDMIDRLINREAKERLKEQAAQYEERLKEQAEQFENEKKEAIKKKERENEELRRQLAELKKRKP